MSVREGASRAKVYPANSVKNEVGNSSGSDSALYHLLIRRGGMVLLWFVAEPFCRGVRGSKARGCRCSRVVCIWGMHIFCL